MDSPIAYILSGVLVTAALYFALLKLINFKSIERDISPAQKALFSFILFYTPLLLIILLIIGSNTALANAQHHNGMAVTFCVAHGILGVMGMLVATHLYKRYKAIGIVLVMNAVSAVFFFLCTAIFMYIG